MDFKNLVEHYHELLSYMKSNKYSEFYIKKFKDEIIRIIKNAETKQWNSYTDIYLEYTYTPHSSNYLRNKRNVIGALEQFDIYGNYPNGRRRHTLFSHGSYHLLVPEFQKLINFYCDFEKKRGKKDSTIHGEALNTASFLYTIQKKGCISLDQITEEAVISFFLSEEGQLIKSCSYKKNIAAVFKAGIAWNECECRRVLCCLPLLREKRKNIQYLVPEEVKKVRQTLEDPSGSLSLRNRAIGLLLLYTGLRGCDVAALVLDSIDWEGERMKIYQQKTKIPLELPLTAIVGNAIYDYLAAERPDTGDKFLFLSETKPYTPLASRSIGSIVTKILRVANIRKLQGERKGTHIFRHNLASSLLENGVPQPIISRTLGHTAPNSLEPYLRADFVHLKKCSIGIDEFPVTEEVLSI